MRQEEKECFTLKEQEDALQRAWEDGYGEGLKQSVPLKITSRQLKDISYQLKRIADKIDFDQDRDQLLNDAYAKGLLDGKDEMLHEFQTSSQTTYPDADSILNEAYAVGMKDGHKEFATTDETKSRYYKIHGEELQYGKNG